MPKYRITSYEVHTQEWEVEANTPEEAREAFQEGEADMNGGSEYNSTLSEEYGREALIEEEE
jgi:hypothetical protein